MNKITTKFRTLGRLSVWGTIAFGIAIATSQTANAWQAINNIDNNVYFLECSKATWIPFRQFCSYPHSYQSYDGEMALGHVLSCGQDSVFCGAGHGQDINVAVPLVGALRLLYPAVHVPPHGVVSFTPGFYTTSDDELYPSIWPIPMPSPICQQWTKIVEPKYQEDYIHIWVEIGQFLCDQAPDRHRVP